LDSAAAMARERKRQRMGRTVGAALLLTESPRPPTGTRLRTRALALSIVALAAGLFVATGATVAYAATHPAITSWSPGSISTAQNQTIAFNGSGFGTGAVWFHERLEHLRVPGPHSGVERGGCQYVEHNHRAVRYVV
jgi:hypothetical protein